MHPLYGWARLSGCCSYTIIIETTFHHYRSTPHRVLTKSWSQILFRIDPPWCCSGIQSYPSSFWSLPPRCCSYSQNHASDTADGPPFRLLLLHTRIMSPAFHALWGHPRFCVYSPKSWCLDRPMKLLLITHRVINAAVLDIITPPKVLTKSCIRHPVRDESFQIVALAQNVSQLFVIRGHPRFSCTHKIMEPNFIRIDPPPSCCSYSQSYQYNRFWSMSHLKVLLITHKKSVHPTLWGWSRLSDCCSYTRIIETTFHRAQATQVCVYSQNHGANFVRIILPSCCSYSQGFINTTVFWSNGPPPGYSQNHASDTGGMDRVSIVCSYTQEWSGQP
jgi:hypothetical protein